LLSRYSTLDVIQSFYIVVQVSLKLFCCILSHFKPMHKGLMYFGFHCIIMFKIQAQMKHKNLCFGCNYPIHSHFNFHCHVQVLCYVHHSIYIVNGCAELLSQFPLLMVMLQCSSDFHPQQVFYCFGC
jgi:hypothetical protein